MLEMMHEVNSRRAHRQNEQHKHGQQSRPNNTAFPSMTNQLPMIAHVHRRLCIAVAYLKYPACTVPRRLMSSPRRARSSGPASRQGRDPLVRRLEVDPSVETAELCERQFPANESRSDLSKAKSRRSRGRTCSRKPRTCREPDADEREAGRVPTVKR